MRNLNRVLIVFFLLQLTLLVSAAPYKIAYTLTPNPPHNGSEAVTSVEIRLEGLKHEKSIQLQMPVWSPGDYHVMDHARYVRNLHAQDPAKGDLTVTHPDDNTWEIQTDGADQMVVTYELPNTRPGFFSENVQVKERYAVYNGPAVYLYVVGHKTDPATLRIALPEGWKQAVVPLDPLPADPAHAREVGFSAPDYDTLADSPIVAGDYVTRSFSFDGRPHTLVFFHAYQGVDYDSFLPIIQKVVAEENRLMGGPPYKRYDFFLEMNGRGGGLEHLNSDRIAWGSNEPARFYSDFVAHEFFHLWNVKRLRPFVLGPFDYIHPPQTRNLWFSEGVTDYYAALSVHRAGLSSESDYLGSLSGMIGQLQSNPARLRVTADESSLRIWEAGNSTGYGGLSYYEKGHLIGLCLDLKIREVTHNRSSLDHVMRDMFARYGLPKPGFPEDGIRDAVIRVGGAELGPFYDRLCRSTEEMPFAECLSYAGLRLEHPDKGHYEITPDPNATPQALALRQAWLSGR